MNLPIVPIFEGAGDVFMRRLQAFTRTLPDVFHNVDTHKLTSSYRGLKKLRFCEKLERGNGVRAFYNQGADILTIYPLAFCIGNRIDQAVYTGFGLRHWHLNISNQDQHIWDQKLVIPVASIIDRFVDFCQEDNMSNFMDVVRKFNRADDRLQVIHICNALVASNVHPKDLKSIDVRQHPATAEFCQGLRPYSLIPLMSAYCGGEHLDKYENAFALYLLNGGKFLTTETSVEAQLIDLFEKVTHVA